MKRSPSEWMRLYSECYRAFPGPCGEKTVMQLALMMACAMRCDGVVPMPGAWQWPHVLRDDAGDPKSRKMLRIE